MHKNSLILLILLLVAFLGTVLFLSRPKKAVLLPNGKAITVEVADTVFKRTKGLMNRKHLDENSGMLFIFDDQIKHIFWMKNTLIPLDMIWLDQNFTVVDITFNAQPCITNLCQTYMPMYPAKYVLEVNGGYSERQKINIGDTFQLK